MEIAGLTFGVIPLAVMVFQGYRLVSNFKTEYCSSNRKLQSILQGILVAESIFKCIFDEILADVVEEDRRKLMLGDPGSEHWTHCDLHEQIKCILGIHFVPVVESVRGTQEALQNIRGLLHKLSGDEAWPSVSKQPFKRLTMGAAVIATSHLQTNPLEQLQFKNIKTHSTSRRLITLVKDYAGELRTLRSQLRSHNDDLLAILYLRSYRNSSSREKSSSQANPTPTPHRASLTPGNQPDGVACGSLDLKVFQTASLSLHSIVSNAPACDCHTTHVCLETPAKRNHAKETLNIEESPHKLPKPFPTGPGARFSFQLFPKPNDSNLRVITPRQPVIHLVFTNRGPNLNDPAIALDSNTTCPAFCTLAPHEGYRGYLSNTSPSGSCDSGFLVQRATTQIWWAKISKFTSLDDLIRCRADELPPPDRFLIAANLAYSLVHFYSSPWIQDWSLQTIHFFEKQEESSTTPGQWTPHLLLKTVQSRFGDTNRDIHLLGIMLLQLGLKNFLNPAVGGQEKLLIEKALSNLCREMGPEYTRFVRSCLFSWGDRSTDLIEDNLSVFLSSVKALEKCAGHFSLEQ